MFKSSKGSISLQIVHKGRLKLLHIVVKKIICHTKVTKKSKTIQSITLFFIFFFQFSFKINIMTFSNNSTTVEKGWYCNWKSSPFLSRFKSIDIVAQKQCNCPLKTMLLAGKVITFALQLAIFLKINKLAMPNNPQKKVFYCKRTTII